MAYEHVKKMMKIANKTQNDLALLFGRQPAVITSLFQGKRRLTTDEAQKLAQFLNVPVQAILDPKYSPDSNAHSGDIDDELLVKCGKYADAILAAKNIKTSKSEYLQLVVEIYRMVSESSTWKEAKKIDLPDKVVELALFKLKNSP